MVQIIFYEKPGCINNTRQKKLLRSAGHTVVAKNLLAEDWSQKPDVLREFFAEKPVCDWFNPSAPVIKQGLIDPHSVTQQQAITLMLSTPLLIRRPLMQVGSHKLSGFNEQEVEQWVGLNIKSSAGDLEQCPKTSSSNCNHA